MIHQVNLYDYFLEHKWHLIRERIIEIKKKQTEEYIELKKGKKVSYSFSNLKYFPFRIMLRERSATYYPSDRVKIYAK